MKILQAHKYYYPRDGATNYMLQLSDMLQEAGHQVIPFSMHGMHNMPTPYSKFFVSAMDLSDPADVALGDKFRYVARMFYSPEAKRNMKKLLRVEHIDVAHVHNIYHHISPSILGELKKEGIPIVMTLHDYKLIGPNYTLFHHGEVHEEDCEGWYATCVKNECMKESKMQSRIVRWEMIFHHKIMKFYERYIDRFIAPSEFIMNLCIKHGWPREKFVHIPHAIDLDAFDATHSNGDYVAYVGRLSQEKGLHVLLEATRRSPDIPFKIIGSGPLESELKQRAKELKLTHVEFTGFQTGKKLMDLLEHARLFVVPSLWYENYPLSILEPKAKAKIVIGSDIGGIPELLPKELLVPAGDAAMLDKAIKTWYAKPLPQRKKMGLKLRKEVEAVNDPATHLEAIEQLYKSL